MDGKYRHARYNAMKICPITTANPHSATRAYTPAGGADNVSTFARYAFVRGALTVMVVNKQLTAASALT
jgi:hypothetical protein